MQRIHLASDHAGFDLKATLAQHLTGLGYEVIDDGAYSKDSCDYPVFAHKLCEAVERENCPGILICGTGIGMSLAANRHPGIRAALCTTELHACVGDHLRDQPPLVRRAARPLRPPPQQRQCALPGRAGHGRGAGFGDRGNLSGKPV